MEAFDRVSTGGLTNGEIRVTPYQLSIERIIRWRVLAHSIGEPCVVTVNMYIGCKSFTVLTQLLMHRQRDVS